MATQVGSSTEVSPIFQLKGGLYTLTALQLLGTNLAIFEEQLNIKIAQAPKFFHNAPVVIDLQKLNQPDIYIDFKNLRSILLKKHLIPVGVKGGHPELQAQAVATGLPLLEGTKERAPVSSAPEIASPTPEVDNALEPELDVRGTQTKVITEPVRSGQQIYARNGDLVVLSSVSHGAELLADGHIHIYGPLRGRALAGVTGDTHARIFCQSLEAELISIAGQYKISEDIEQSNWQLAVEVSLEGGRLHIRPL